MRRISLLLYCRVLHRLTSRSVAPMGANLRNWAPKLILRQVSRNVNITHGVRFGRGRGLSLGLGPSIGECTRIICMDVATIGDNVMILTGGHDYKVPMIQFIDQEVVSAPFVIGDDVWIGAEVLILPGVTVGHRYIIGAGSLVTKDVPPHTLVACKPVAGNSVRPIKSVA
jgi:acetyltransferase-like isoleucine patch superfamily enzyme